MVDQKHTHFTYQEFVWRSYPCSLEGEGEGEGTAGVRWPRFILGPDQRVGERQATYQARFLVEDDRGDVADLGGWPEVPPDAGRFQGQGRAGNSGD
jgi:hypothetical protein